MLMLMLLSELFPRRSRCHQSWILVAYPSPESLPFLLPSARCIMVMTFEVRTQMSRSARAIQLLVTLAHAVIETSNSFAVFLVMRQCNLVGCYQQFQAAYCSPSPTVILNAVAVCSSEMLINTSQGTRCRNLDVRSANPHCHYTFESHTQEETEGMRIACARCKTQTGIEMSLLIIVSSAVEIIWNEDCKVIQTKYC
jgi:hypothetical protein